jgi:hypothetical protein
MGFSVFDFQPVAINSLNLGAQHSKPVTIATFDPLEQK